VEGGRAREGGEGKGVREGGRRVERGEREGGRGVRSPAPYLAALMAVQV